MHAHGNSSKFLRISIVIHNLKYSISGTILRVWTAFYCGLQSAADLQRLHNRQWDWALAVHGSEDAALAAGGSAQASQ